MASDLPRRARIVVTDANVLINLIHVDRLSVLGALPNLEFVVPPEVESEVRGPAQADALARAVGNGYLRRQSFTTIAELQRYARHAQVLGRGEAACLAMAEEHGWSIASDERGKFWKLASVSLGPGRVLNTPGVFVLAIRADLITVDQADIDKRTLANNRFTMAFASFREVIGGSGTAEEAAPGCIGSGMRRF